ncbi:DUF262 domain-containing protein [Ruegeria faecimaris]|uniref:DUF262 domain-containing protein n=1 Tax=Ruegeria faecimaris TaxID=686389 RepID=UPI00248F4A7A|nr:DUF262 domain-containing protein [Ruegeria faecimaris]
MYKPGGTIADALTAIASKEYVLPAIQREFVWKPAQIEKLFDSLMQGYPFGTFLFWKVNAETSSKFKFYDFVLNYHQRDAAHCPELGPIHHREVVAVLDGQQRLTALNIGLRGSMAIKLPNRWWTNPDAFPLKTLYLNLIASNDPDEDGVCYEFRFLTEEQATRTETTYWFPVPKALLMEDGPAMLTGLMADGLEKEELQVAYKNLDRLHSVIHKDNLINYFEEKTQDLERVLNIFIRLNSGGTVLSYSDLLLSVAVAQWKQIDARSEIHKCVDELNRTGAGFDFSQDFVLKAGLMLADIASVGFKVENFTSANMAKLEAEWSKIRSTLIKTVELVASFGLNGQTLRADSAILPIAYYLHQLGPPQNYVTHTSFQEDRKAIQMWLIHSLLKASGIWGSGLDTLLTALRETIQKSGQNRFPSSELGRVMAQRGKSLSFGDDEIEELLHVRYGDKRTFALLSLLFPFVDLRNQFHVDHVFPISRFTPTKLKKMGFDEELSKTLAQLANELPNLQLLEGAMNNEKRAKLPADWLQLAFNGNIQNKENYQEKHALEDIPENLEGFQEFIVYRREKLRDLIQQTLNAEKGV